MIETKRRRKELDVALFAAEFVEGYSHTRAEQGKFPDYGYSSNCLPVTDGKPRKLESSFLAAKS